MSILTDSSTEPKLETTVGSKVPEGSAVEPKLEMPDETSNTNTPEFWDKERNSSAIPGFVSEASEKPETPQKAGMREADESEMSEDIRKNAEGVLTTLKESREKAINIINELAESIDSANKRLNALEKNRKGMIDLKKQIEQEVYGNDSGETIPAGESEKNPYSSSGVK